MFLPWADGWGRRPEWSFRSCVSKSGVPNLWAQAVAYSQPGHMSTTNSCKPYSCKRWAPGFTAHSHARRSHKWSCMCTQLPSHKPSPLPLPPPGQPGKVGKLCSKGFSASQFQEIKLLVSLKKTCTPMFILEQFPGPRQNQWSIFHSFIVWQIKVVNIGESCKAWVFNYFFFFFFDNPFL